MALLSYTKYYNAVVIGLGGALQAIVRVPSSYLSSAVDHSQEFAWGLKKILLFPETRPTLVFTRRP